MFGAALGPEMLWAYWSVLVQGFSKIPHAPLDTGFLLSHDVPVWCIPGQYFPWSSIRSHGCPRGTFKDFKSIMVVKKRLFVVALFLVHDTHVPISCRHAHMWTWRQLITTWGRKRHFFTTSPKRHFFTTSTLLKSSKSPSRTAMDELRQEILSRCPVTFETELERSGSFHA